MPEQEKRAKVIKGLEAILEETADMFYRSTIQDALALLKAQEPDETRLVRHYSRPNVYADLWLHCEKCGGRVDDRYKPKFCPECGRKVNWE
jgi:rubrerythrin